MNSFPVNISSSLSTIFFIQGEIKWTGESVSILGTENCGIRVFHESEVGITDLLEISINYISPIEEKAYIFTESLSNDCMLSYGEVDDYEFIKTECYPYGTVAIWFCGEKKSKLISHKKAKEIDLSDYIKTNKKAFLLTQDYYVSYTRENEEIKKLPAKDLIVNYIKQFTYRYLFLFEHWDKDNDEWQKYYEEETAPELDYIEEALFDGTHDKLHDGGLLNYHQAGKPKKLAIKWHIKKSEYTAYFWFEDEEIRTVFDRFYGAHPETKTDFMIRIDSDNKKFELALYRYGLKEPQVISESAYQLLVFKNKFEYYRSENYNQPKGAWIW